MAAKLPSTDTEYVKRSVNNNVGGKAELEVENNSSSAASRKKFDAFSGSELNLELETEKEGDLTECPVNQPMSTDVAMFLSELCDLENMAHNRVILYKCTHVKLYFIKPNGEVESLPKQYNIAVFKVKDVVFLEAGDWVYPLFPSVSLCSRASDGAFLFPDIHSDVEGATVALLLPKPEREKFYEVLSNVLADSDGDSDGSRPRRSAMVSISDNINTGSSYLASALVRASSTVASRLDSAIAQFSHSCTEPVDLGPTLEKTAHIAQKVTAKADFISGTASSYLGSAVLSFGKFVSSRMAGSVTPETGKVAANIFDGISNIFGGLEQSGEILAHAISRNTVKFVENRYGPPAARVTSDVLSAMGNIYSIRRNFNVWKPKNIGKNIVKSAGRAILEDQRNSSYEH